MHKWRNWLIAMAVLLAVWSTAAAAPVTLVEDGEARVSVVVPTAALEVDPEGDLARGQPVDRPLSTEVQMRMLRLAAEDVATYLERMSGAAIEIDDEPVEGLTPIHIGRRDDVPGQIEPSVSSEFGDAYVIDANEQRIVLTGESARATYYAAARLLHQLGVRWYAPGELGEHVPSSHTLAVESGRIESAPDFQTRNLWGRAPEETRWLLRNRLAGPRMPQGHAFARYQRPVDGSGSRQSFFEENPDFFPVINGEPRMHQANLSNPEVAEHFAAHIRRIFENNPERWTAGIGPDDGAVIDERPETHAIIRGQEDPLMRLPDATDLFIRFANRIARELEGDYPDAKLGFYVYSNHAGVPQDEPPHEMLFPVIAPISYSRYSSIGNPQSATSMMLADNIQRWGELTDDIGFYLYNFNLADTAMPFTRTLAFGESIPKLYDWGMRYGTIESMTNWHTAVPGNYVTANLLWDVESDREALESEVYENYFGPASDAMRQYNHVLEQAYENTDAHAGNLWSMHRILNENVRKQLESALSRAEQAASDEEPYASRVEIMRYGLNYADHWFAAREALNDFRLEEAADHADAFVANYEQANEQYPLFFAERNTGYFNAFHKRSFDDARRVAEEGQLLYEFPDTWQAYFDPQMLGHRMGLGDPKADTGNWTELKTYSATISDQGFPHYRGLIWYRHSFELPAPEEQAQTQGLFGPPNESGPTKLKLWFAGTDSTVHVYLNGEDLGRHSVRNFGPTEIDITGAARAGAENTLIVAVDNTGIVELGTGGIMRPVAIYQTK